MNYLLFTTTRCPKCPEFKAVVADKVTNEGRVLNELDPDFGELAAQHNVTAAPTIIFFDEGGEVFRTSDLSELDSFLNN